MQFVHLIFTYFISSLIIMACLKKMSIMTDGMFPHVPLVLVGVGPTIISLLTYFLLLIIPGQEPIIYLGVIYTIFGIMAFCARRELVWLVRNTYRTVLSGFSVMTLLGIIVIGCYAFVVVIVSLDVLRANDFLKYLSASKIIYNDMSFLGYPFQGPNPETGFYFRSAHPPAFISLIVWTFICCGVTGTSALKVIVPFFACSTLLGVYGLVSKKSKEAALASVVLLATTPVFFLQSVAHSIDMVRIYTLFVIIAVIFMVDIKSIKNSVFIGVCAALSLFSHTLGILTVIFVPTALLLRVGYKKAGEVFPYMALTMAVLLAIGGVQFVKNYINIGSFFVTETPLFNMVTNLDIQGHYHEAKGLLGWYGLVKNGWLAILLRPLVFGFTYWLLLLYMVAGIRKGLEQSWLRIFFAIIAEFLGFMLLYYIKTGDALNFAHYRYYLTIQPFVCILGALAVSNIYKKLIRQRTM